MHWLQNDIAAALTLCRERDAILMAVIMDECQQDSSKLLNILSDENVDRKLNAYNIIGVVMSNNSNLNEIDENLLMRSLLFLNKLGEPLKLAAMENISCEEELMRVVREVVLMAEKWSNDMEEQQTSQIQLLFRFGDGKKAQRTFDPQLTLAEVHTMVKSDLRDYNKNACSHFNFATAIPKRIFSKTDERKTLLELELYPNAVLLVIQNQLWIKTLAHAFVTIINLLLLYLHSVLSPMLFAYELEKVPVKRMKAASRKKNMMFHKKKVTRIGKRYGPSSNVHRLSDNADDDDDGTYNGNYTQQQ